MELQAAFDHLLSNESPLDGLDALVWHSLAAGATASKHPWATGCLTTISKSGDEQSFPSSRTVVLRRCDVAARTLDFHTDARSPKVQELECGQAAVCWLFYHPSTKIQLRLQGTASVVNDRQTDAAWEAVSLLSRSAYLSFDPPSKAVTGSRPPSTTERFVELAESERGRENFRLIRTQVELVDWLYLRQGGHVRASIAYDEKSSVEASWLIP
jgi:pyridoxamine 5'-phosphate oxidase